MNWPRIAEGFLDELVKISDINLSGLSPENVIKGSTPPPPMETAGFSKARDILGRAEMSKTSATKHVKRMLPTNPTIGKLTHQGDESKAEKAKSVAGYGAAGAGLGTLVGKIGLESPIANKWAAKGNALGRANKAMKLKNMGWGAMMAGGATGLAYGANRQRLKAQHNKQAEMTKLSLSPGMELKSSKQTAKPLNKVKSGPGLKAQTSGLIGRKGGIP